MIRFSQRIGNRPIKTNIQVEGMDDELRNGLWNAFTVFYLQPIKADLDNVYADNKFKGFLFGLWCHYFSKPVDEMPQTSHRLHELLKAWFFDWEWDEVYDFIEGISQIDAPIEVNKYIKYCNIILEKELSAWRFIDRTLTKITDQQQMDSIDSVIKSARKHKLTTVETHFNKALDKFSDRKNPDYRNSIKESISAVEAICRMVAGKENATLGDALDEIERVGAVIIHGALKEGFKKIYGYTSDGDGIRHALKEGKKVEAEDALYMLVSCSAFVNYLITKSEKSGIKLTSIK